MTPLQFTRKPHADTAQLVSHNMYVQCISMDRRNTYTVLRETLQFEIANEISATNQFYGKIRGKYELLHNCSWI